MKVNKATLCLSGGADSSVLLYMIADRGYKEIHTLTFDYGQRHSREIECVDKQIQNLKVAYPDIVVTNKVLDVKYISQIAPTSSLTNTQIDNPDINKMAGDAQPVSYVPFRNMMFLSICLSQAESVGADRVFYGATQVDSLGGFWDATSEMVEAINSVTSLNRKNQIKVEAPLIEMSKADIVREGVRLGVKFENTWTCYSNREDRLADATTPSSSLRIKGFIDAKLRDPIQYVQQDKINKLYEDTGCKYITPIRRSPYLPL